MKIENVVDIGEGTNFVHIFCDPNQSIITEVNLHASNVESITVYDESAASEPHIVDPSGNPISGDEVQSAEQLPVEQDDAGSTPVVPAISEE